MPKVTRIRGFSALTENATESTILGRILATLAAGSIIRRSTHLIEKYGISETLCPDCNALMLDSNCVRLPDSTETRLVVAA
jgi:hypothetical protein